MNFDAEMTRYGIRNADLCELLGYTEKTIQNKRKNVSCFSVGEAMKIRDTFFPELRIEYLFAPDKEETEQEKVR